MSSTHAETEETNFAATKALHDEEQLVEYLNDTIIPCASCGEEIDVDDSFRWINRLVCSVCIGLYEGLDESDEDNYDDVYEEEAEA